MSPCPLPSTPACMMAASVAAVRSLGGQSETDAGRRSIFADRAAIGKRDDLRNYCRPGLPMHALWGIAVLSNHSEPALPHAVGSLAVHLPTSQERRMCAGGGGVGGCEAGAGAMPEGGRDRRGAAARLGSTCLIPG